jgi:hypothetical protein
MPAFFHKYTDARKPGHSKVLLPFPGLPLEAARGMASKITVAEGGPAGSGVLEATISAAPKRLGGAGLGRTKIKAFFGYFAEIRLRVCSGRFLPSARFARFGRMELEAIP